MKRKDQVNRIDYINSTLAVKVRLFSARLTMKYESNTSRLPPTPPPGGRWPTFLCIACSYDAPSP